MDPSQIEDLNPTTISIRTYEARYFKNDEVSCPIPILVRYSYRRSIEQLKLLFLKNNYRYVSDTSPIHVSEKYQKNNIFYDRNGGDETDIMCFTFK
jgi:hypothetical protein